MIYLLTKPIILIGLYYTEQFFKPCVIVGSIFFGRYRLFQKPSNILKSGVIVGIFKAVTSRKKSLFHLLLTKMFVFLNYWSY